jgi:hypothetical protein
MLERKGYIPTAVALALMLVLLAHIPGNLQPEIYQLFAFCASQIF